MLDSVKDYYGKTLQGSADLKTDACCTLEAPPDYLRDAMALIHPEVTARYYGCGLVVPPAVEGLKVLDLGCGAGRDAYLLSALVGEQGHVVGVDMTDEQLAVARAHMDYHREAFGYARGNVEFKQGYLEALETVDLEADSFDLIVSNCVINLCPDKAAVFREALRVLRPGGELYFSDVYADRRVPEALTQDPVLHGECLSGALYWRDFARLAEAAGFAPPRLIDSRRLGIEDAEVEEKVGDIGFYSATYRLFKLEAPEAAEENYGRSATYRGTLAQHPDSFPLDRQHNFLRGEATPVSGNTWQILRQSRFWEHFDFIDGPGKHLGPFAPAIDLDPATAAAPKKAGGGCC